MAAISGDDFKNGWNFLEDVTSNAAQVQDQVLEEILSRNSNTKYLESFLHGDSSKEAFKKNVPVVEYDGIKSYVEQIVNGESSHHILSMEPISEFLQSSGTSGGKRKLVPSTIEYLNKKLFAHNLISIVLMKYINGFDREKHMFLRFVKPETKTPSGLMARFYTTSLTKHIERLNGPNEEIYCADDKQSMYSQLLCGLLERDHIVIIGSYFASSVLNFIGFLEDHWKEMCSNTRTGIISDWITDPSCRHSISLILGKPYPDLADSIEQACSGKSWQGIVRKIWPQAKGILAIITGSMAQYVPSLEYYGGGLPLLSTLYSSSECFVGLNLNPLCHPYDVSYTILPNMAYFEFLPVNSDLEESSNFATKENIVGLTDVKVGQSYEVVATTITGLYRYRVGDIVKVTGYYNNAPKVQILGRKGVLLSITSDKTTEEDLSKAVRESMLPLEQQGFLLVDYTSYCDTTSRPGHYVIFWELKKNQNICDEGLLDSKMMEECCFTMEESLDATYRFYRSKNEIAPLEIRVVKSRTFDALMEFFVSKGAAFGQYKTPRGIKPEEAINLLNSHVVGSFFSPKSPPK